MKRDRPRVRVVHHETDWWVELLSGPLWEGGRPWSMLTVPYKRKSVAVLNANRIRSMLRRARTDWEAEHGKTK